MNSVRFPSGFRMERLCRDHVRRQFQCGEEAVDNWLATKALQHQEKHLSVTKVLLAPEESIAGYYTLATGQVDLHDLPAEVGKSLPWRSLPVAVLAWLGGKSERRGQGLGSLLLAQALRECWKASKTFAFVAVILDCINDAVKGFSQKWDFAELPGHPSRLFLSVKRLEAMMKGP